MSGDCLLNIVKRGVVTLRNPWLPVVLGIFLAFFHDVIDGGCRGAVRHGALFCGAILSTVTSRRTAPAPQYRRKTDCPARTDAAQAETHPMHRATHGDGESLAVWLRPIRPARGDRDGMRNGGPIRALVLGPRSRLGTDPDGVGRRRFRVCGWVPAQTAANHRR